MTKIAIFESEIWENNPRDALTRQEQINKQIAESGIKEEQIMEMHCYHYIRKCSVVDVPVDAVQILYKD